MTPKVYFKSLSLENVRCFGKKQEIFFTDNGKADGNVSMWNVILGENGTGKTTVLKALTMIYGEYSLEIEKLVHNLHWKRANVSNSILKIVTNNNYNYPVRIHYKEGATSLKHEIENEKITEKTYSSYYDTIFNINLLAYGASRKMRKSLEITEKNNYPFQSLFNDNSTLINVEEWLVQADYLAYKNQNHQKYRLVVEALKKLLKDEVFYFDISIKDDAPQVFFKTHYGDVRLHELSLGYKTLLAWITDFAKNLVEKYPNSQDPLAEPAVCLVDEIDLHMHPKMQRTVVKFLRETFPQTQFIVTAHSPLIVQSEEDTNIILLRRNGDEVEVFNEVDNIQNWRIDQILESDLFGNQSSYRKEIQQKIDERRSILLKDEVKDADKERINEIDESLNNLSITESKGYLQTLKILADLQND
jgi:predicted ATP-binding protein involved in virulence